MDKYIKKQLKAVGGAKNGEEGSAILSKIYDDGFQDGINDRSKKQYKGSIIFLHGGLLQENIPFKTGKEAERIFLKLCRAQIFDFKKLSKKKIENCIEEGYAESGGGKGDVSIMWF